MKYEKYSWFFGSQVDAVEAQDMLLRVKKDGCFLVRISSTKRYYVLTMYTARSRPFVFHFEIFQTTSGKFHLNGESETFASLPELIQHLMECDNHMVPGKLKSTVPRTSTVAPKPTPSAAARANVQRASQEEKCISKWEIDISELDIIEQIGYGSFGKVHRAKLRGSAMVAVKMLIPGAMSEDQFIAEAKVMTELKHPHIVRLCGICVKKRPIFIVTEFMSYGSLLTYLGKYKRSLLTNHQSLLCICAQVVDGMAYLERQRFIHRDLACRNCLVGANGAVKVSDFGMSKFMTSNIYKANQQSVFPIFSVPPEVLKDRLFSNKSDVWQFGLLMWEVFTCGESPWGNMNQSVVVNHVTKGFRLVKPPAAEDADYKVLSSCLQHSASDRPSFAVLNKQLKAMVY